MDLFKEKIETWEGKLVRLKRDCKGRWQFYSKGLLMRVSCVSNAKITLQPLPCSLLCITSGIVDFMTIKGRKKDYANYFEFVEEKGAEK